MAKRHRLGETVDKAECIIWTGATNGAGYPVKWREGKARMYNRDLWRQLRGPIPKGRCVCHKCDNPKCVNIDHLFLGTYRQNAIDCVKKGRANRARGERHGLSKLTEKDIREIRRLYETKEMNVSELSKRHGVARSVIYKAISRVTWKHVE
jgi:hypothetical protein